jgi:hypothetical protein
MDRYIDEWQKIARNIGFTCFSHPEKSGIPVGYGFTMVQSKPPHL